MNYASEVKLRAERKAGDLLAEMDIPAGRKCSHDESNSLASIGIDHNQSHRWQKMASIPESDFNAYVEKVKDGIYSPWRTPRHALQCEGKRRAALLLSQQWTPNRHFGGSGNSGPFLGFQDCCSWTFRSACHAHRPPPPGRSCVGPG